MSDRFLGWWTFCFGSLAAYFLLTGEGSDLLQAGALGFHIGVGIMLYGISRRTSTGGRDA